MTKKKLPNYKLSSEDVAEILISALKLIQDEGHEVFVEEKEDGVLVYVSGLRLTQSASIISE